MPPLPKKPKRKLNFVQPSEEEQKRILDQIREDARKDKKRRRTMIVLSVLAALVYYFLRSPEYFKLLFGR